MIAGIGLMGCIPSILAQSAAGLCSESVNQLIVPFNLNSKAMINNLTLNLPGSRFAYIDVHNMFQDLLTNSESYGTIFNFRVCTKNQLILLQKNSHHLLQIKVCDPQLTFN